MESERREGARSISRARTITINIARNVFPSAPGFAAGVPYNGSLGSAIEFFLRRVKEVAADGGDATKLDLPNWNLDGDRGYGFKCWQVTANALEPPPVAGVATTYDVNPNQP